MILRVCVYPKKGVVLYVRSDTYPLSKNRGTAKSRNQTRVTSAKNIESTDIQRDRESTRGCVV